MIATPAESYPRYSSRDRPARRMAWLSRGPTYPTIPHMRPILRATGAYILSAAPVSGRHDHPGHRRRAHRGPGCWRETERDAAVPTAASRSGFLGVGLIADRCVRAGRFRADERRSPERDLVLVADRQDVPHVEPLQGLREIPPVPVEDERAHLLARVLVSVLRLVVDGDVDSVVHHVVALVRVSPAGRRRGVGAVLGNGDAAGGD